MTENKTYRAVLYLRLSREDGDRQESNSIGGQRALLEAFLARQPDILPGGEIVDDGYSGAVFERPGFLRLMELIRLGETDCVLVKDLSRFGRNYIETGRYLEQIFPLLGVRFIAVNDGYDSAGQTGQADSILLPFQNLMNDAYCRDISRKVKTQLAVKRLRGDFTGAFAPYGYCRSAADRTRLAPDLRTAPVVRQIFRWTLEGISHAGIAQRLEQAGVLPPAAQKRAAGQAYFTPFEGVGSWSAVAVGRILTNPVYIGTLRQGKTERPDFRSAQRRVLPCDQWTVAENRHPAIVSPAEFQAVQRLLGRDLRTAPGQEARYPLSGMVVCGGCGQTMLRKTVPAGGKRYVYYVCANGCGKSRLEETKAWAAVSALLTRLVELGESEKPPQKSEQMHSHIEAQLAREREKLRELHVDFAEGLLDAQTFTRLNARYTAAVLRLERVAQSGSRLPEETGGNALLTRLMAVLIGQVETAEKGEIRVIMACARRGEAAEGKAHGEEKQEIHTRSVRRFRLCRSFGKAG